MHNSLLSTETDVPATPDHRRAARPGRAGRPFLQRCGHHRGSQPREKVAALGKIAAFVPDAGPGIEMRPQSWAPRQSTERRRRSPMTLAGLTVSTPPLVGMCRRLGDRVSAQSHQLCAGFGQACHATDAAHSGGYRALCLGPPPSSVTSACKQVRVGPGRSGRGTKSGLPGVLGPDDELRQRAWHCFGSWTGCGSAGCARSHAEHDRPAYSHSPERAG